VRSRNPKVVTAPADPYVQPRFEQPQILIQWTAQIREPCIVRRFEIEFARAE
jgi:hypothetical protein